MIIGCVLEIPLMCCVAGIGGGPMPSDAGIHAVVACNILFTCFAREYSSPD